MTPPPRSTIEQQGEALKNALDFFWEVVEGSDLQDVLDAQGGLGIGSRINGLVAQGWRVEPPGTAAVAVDLGESAQAVTEPGFPWGAALAGIAAGVVVLLALSCVVLVAVQ